MGCIIVFATMGGRLASLDALSLIWQASWVVQLTILTSIGLHANPMAWQARGPGYEALAEELRTEAAVFLAALYNEAVAADNAKVAEAALGGMLTAGHHAALPLLDPESKAARMLTTRLAR